MVVKMGGSDGGSSRSGTLEREISASNWIALWPFLLDIWRRMLPVSLFIERS